MRGKGSAVKVSADLTGITPAHAGKRKALLFKNRECRDHPRTCGEKKLVIVVALLWIGSPPHMRGKDYKSGIK